MSEPLRRVHWDDVDEIGIYSLPGGVLQLLLFDQQGNEVFDFPIEGARALGEALIATADDWENAATADPLA